MRILLHFARIASIPHAPRSFSECSLRIMSIKPSQVSTGERGLDRRESDGSLCILGIRRSRLSAALNICYSNLALATCYR